MTNIENKIEKYYIVKTLSNTKICSNNIVKLIKNNGSRDFGSWNFKDGSICAEVEYYYLNKQNEIEVNTIHIHNKSGNASRFVVEADYIYFDENGKISFDGKFFTENGWVEKLNNKMTLKEAYEDRVFLQE